MFLLPLTTVTYFFHFTTSGIWNVVPPPVILSISSEPILSARLAIGHKDFILGGFS